MKQPTDLEKVTGSLAVVGTATIAAAIAGGPAAALLPLLLATLASTRHKKRVESALSQIEKDLNKFPDKLENISDAQYKFINESIITILHSPDDSKIEFLKNGINRAAVNDRINLHQAGLLSRILRDITVEELTFLIECSGKKIIFHETPKDGYISIKKLSMDDERARGLISLGLLTKEVADGIWDDNGTYIFTSASEKLIELVG